MGIRRLLGADMKIRWTSTSVRLRITPTELAAMMRNEIVREEIRFGSASWSVCVVAGCAHTDYRIMDGAFIIYLSVNDREELADPEAEGIYFEPTDQSPVRLSIEKDYPCEHPRGADAKEPQTETFAAPCADAEEAIAGEIDTPPAAC